MLYFLLFCLRTPPKIIEPTQSDINNTPMTPNNSQLDFEDFCALFDSFR